MNFPYKLPNEKWFILMHWWLRTASFPFSELLKFLPKQGSGLDFGCGWGILTSRWAQRAPQMKLVAGDISIDKIKVAKRILKYLPQVKVIRFSKQLLGWRSKFDVITVIDVLYLVDDHEKKDLIYRLASWLKPKGKLVIAIVPNDGSWRYLLAWLQEWVMVKLLGATASQKQKINFETETDLKQMLRQTGLKKISRQQLPTCWPFVHKHIVFVANK